MINAPNTGRTAVVHSGVDPGDLGAWIQIHTEEGVAFTADDDCPCCALRLDLVTIIEDLCRRRTLPDHVIITTTGDADVATIVATLLANELPGNTVHLDGIVVVADPAVSEAGQGWSPDDEPTTQRVAIADRVVCDIAALSDLGLQRLVTIGAFDPHTTARRLEGLHPSQYTVPNAAASSGWSTALVAVAGNLDPHRLEDWIAEVQYQLGADLLRLEAVLAIDDEPNRWVGHGCRTALRFSDGSPWGDTPRRSVIRLVGSGLDTDSLADRLQWCLLG